MTTYVDQVAAELGSLRREQRKAALDDLRAALADGATEDELGPPHDYAAMVLDAYAADEDGEEATVFGVPWETRGPTDASVRARVWDPADPRILVPRLFGLGWTVNLGAVAVRLGLIQPDDWDDESLDAVDPRLLTVLRVVPLAWWAAAMALSVRTWRRGEPVPTHWGRGGVADRWSGRAAALVPAVIATGFAVWGTRPTTGDDRMIRPGLGSAGAALAAATALMTETAMAHPEGRRGLNVPTALAALVLPAHLAVPVTAALRARRRH